MKFSFYCQGIFHYIIQQPELTKHKVRKQKKIRNIEASDGTEKFSYSFFFLFNSYFSFFISAKEWKMILGNIREKRIRKEWQKDRKE